MLIAQPLPALMNFCARKFSKVASHNQKAHGMSLVNSRPSPRFYTRTQTHTLACAIQFMSHRDERKQPQLHSHSKRGAGQEPYQVKDWRDFLPPWRACEANMILEFSEVQERFLSGVNTSWPLHMVILQWHQRSWLRIDCLNKKSGLTFFIF